MTNYDTLLEVANANKALVTRQKVARNHEESERRNRQMMAHYLFFVQLREAMVKDGEVTPEQAERATRVAGGPFFPTSV